MTSEDDDFDICLAAYKRQRVRAQRKASAALQSLDRAASDLRGQIKGFPTRLINSVSGPSLDESASLKRMHVPPMVNCECNGISVCALLNTSCAFSTMSEHTVRRLRLSDQIVTWKQVPAESGYQRLLIPRGSIRGCVKYVDLTFGSWKQVYEFAVVEECFPEVSLGIDFLRRSQTGCATAACGICRCLGDGAGTGGDFGLSLPRLGRTMSEPGHDTCLINFEAAVLLVGGARGEKVQLLSAKEISSQSMAALPRASAL